MRWSPIATTQIVLGIVLSAALAYLWLHPDLSLKNMRWQPPPAHAAALQTLLEPPVLPARALADDSAALLVIQERPLFVLSRRPVPPEPVVKEAASAVKSSWDSAVLVGVFTGGASGIIFRRDGKDHRLMLNQSFEGWTLQSVEPLRARVVRSGQSVVLELRKAEMSALGRAAPLTVAATPARSARARAEPPPTVAAPQAEPQTQPEAQEPAASPAPQAATASPAPTRRQPVFGGTKR